MDYEKKYKETIEKLRDFYRDYDTVSCLIDVKEELANLFPELKESENEKIREQIISFLKEFERDHYRNLDFSSWITWLEKQGDKDKLIKELGEYKVKYTQEVLSRQLEKQGEQPRYSIGDVLCDKSCTTLNKDAQPNFEITDIRNGMYICDKCSFPISQQNEYELVAKKIEQKPAEWSEEDEYMLDETIQHLEELIRIDKAKHCGVDVQYYQRDIDWLKSLKPQNHWKPSDEQLRELRCVISGCSFEISILMELEKQLKAL